MGDDFKLRARSRYFLATEITHNLSDLSRQSSAGTLLCANGALLKTRFRGTRSAVRAECMHHGVGWGKHSEHFQTWFMDLSGTGKHKKSDLKRCICTESVTVSAGHVIPKVTRAGRPRVNEMTRSTSVVLSAPGRTLLISSLTACVPGSMSLKWKRP